MERVQTYSHPLWLGALTAAHAVTSEPFYSTLHLSWLVSCMAVVCLVFGRPGGCAERLLGVGLMLCSRAFVDYSTSGLENPLTHLLIALFAVEALHPVRSDARYGRLAIIAGLAGCNRLDTVALFLPALAQAFPRERARGLRALGWIAVPLLAWEAFSLFYYGFLFPNVAYAKLTTGIAGDQHRLLDGAHYFWTSITDDPLTLGTIALAFAFAARHKDRPGSRCCVEPRSTSSMSSRSEATSWTVASSLHRSSSRWPVLPRATGFEPGLRCSSQCSPPPPQQLLTNRCPG